MYGFGNFLLGGFFPLGRQDQPKRPDAEEPFPAGVAAVGRESQQSFGENQGAVVNTFSRNAIEVEISALGAMRQVDEAQRHTPRIKAQFARLAAPRTASRQREEKISGSGTMGAETFGAAALWANHQYILSNLRQHSQKTCPKQDALAGFSTGVV
jgi:hypothetical protein